jgi:hypothetical protein
LLCDLRLAGLDLNQLSPLEESLLTDRLEDRNTIQYLQTRVIVQAIGEAAKIIAAGTGSFDATNKTLKQLHKLLFPDAEDTKERNAEQTKKLLEKEFARGPMKVKALDYGRKKKPNRR